MLWSHCIGMDDQNMMMTLLSYGHATWIWRNSRIGICSVILMVFHLVWKGWFESANILLSWPTTVAQFTEEDMMYLTKRPFMNGYEFMDMPLSAAKRSWLLNHPALTEKTRKARNHMHWLLVLFWTGRVKSFIRKWEGAKIPLPEPSIENIEALTMRLRNGTYRLSPNSPMRMDMLAWVALLAKESPVIARRLIPMIYKGKEKGRGQWEAEVVEAVASAGRIQLLSERLRIFQKTAEADLKRTKVLQWLTESAFAVPRIARSLINMSTYFLNKECVGNSNDVKQILQSHVVVTTIPDIAAWLAIKMPDSGLLNLARKKRSYPAVAAALQATERYGKLQCIVKFRAVAFLTLFFRRYVTAEKPRKVVRGDCPICWTSKILQPLHDDIRHGMCYRCMRRLQRKNMLHQCPMCRTPLSCQP